MRVTTIIIFLLISSLPPQPACGQGRACVLLPCKPSLSQASLDSAVAQVGVREKTGRNDGYKIKSYLNSVGLPEGNPYCAAGQYWCFAVAAKALRLPLSDIPLRRTGSTSMMFDDAIARGFSVYNGPRYGCLVFWRRPNDWRGHVERVVEVHHAGWVTTVGFNTSAGPGSQREGEGVYLRKRNVNHFLGRMVLRGFICFPKDEL